MTLFIFIFVFVFVLIFIFISISISIFLLVPAQPGSSGQRAVKRLLLLLLLFGTYYTVLYHVCRPAHV